MQIELSADRIISEVTNALTDYEDYTRKLAEQKAKRKSLANSKLGYNDFLEAIRKIDKDERWYSVSQDKAIAQLSVIRYIFRAADLEKAARTVKKWNEKVQWQICLTEETQARLINLYAKNS